MYIKYTTIMKLRQSGGGRAFVTLIQELYFKTIRNNIIIYRFSLVDKVIEKEEKKNTLGTNPRG